MWLFFYLGVQMQAFVVLARAQEYDWGNPDEIFFLCIMAPFGE